MGSKPSVDRCTSFNRATVPFLASFGKLMSGGDQCLSDETNGDLRMWTKLIAACAATLCLALPLQAEPKFQRIATQFIAALGPSGATSGTDAATWGHWEVDPGPRGVRLRNYEDLKAAAGLAPAGWQFDPAAWWIEENGLIMEAPVFPLSPGAYVVTGGRETTAVLTVSPPDATGAQNWALSDAATIYDVTHLRCRAAVYTPVAGQSCTPDNTPQGRFPMPPAEAMPAIDGCAKREYQVLIVVGMMMDE